MRSVMRLPLVLASMLLASACTSIPEGPSTLVLPGTGKSFDQFRADDFDCRQYARAQIGGTTPNQAAVSSSVQSAAVGTAVGAAAGAAIGGNRGVGVGAGTGLLAGSVVGTETGTRSGYELQRRYDFGYLQCMYAKGNRIPVWGNFTPATARPASPPPPYYAPPPPPPPR